MGSGEKLEKGKYTLIGIDVDTTGRRLIDEIVQLAAYTPKQQYSQYIMPYMNLNPAARQRHQIRVVTIGFYRMLKSMHTFKVVKSKSEISALNEFLDWIELVKGGDPDSKGIILLFHEERKFIPYMILEAMAKYDLIDRFSKTVKSFVNGFELAKLKCVNKCKYFSLRQLSKFLLDNNNPNADKKQFEGNASVRARLAYEIAQHLAEGEENNINAKNDDAEAMLKMVIDYAEPLSKEFNELEIQSKNLEHQNSFRPVFLHYFKSTLYHRVKAVKYRIILAENGYNYDNFKAIWTEKRKEGLSQVIQGIDVLKAEDKTELIELLDCHFDPTKEPFQPLVKPIKKRQRRYKNKENLMPMDNLNDGDKVIQPADTRAKTPTKKFGRTNRNTMNSISNRNSLPSKL